MMTIEEAVEQFNFELPEEVRFTCQSPEFVMPLQEVASAYNLDFSALLIYFAVGEVTTDNLADYLRTENNLDEVMAQKIAKEVEEKALRPLIERIEFLNDDPQKSMSLPQEKAYLERMFKSDLLKELTEDPVIAAAVNSRLFAVLAREEDFHKRLEQMLYENDELVTEKPLVIDNQNVKPTVANWVKDFISHYGSQSYDSVSLSSFLINSENGRHLSDQEREAVSLVLKVYTNIKFFPESMPEDETGESWQIIPFDDVEKELAKAADQIGSASQPLKPVASQPAAPQPVSPSAPESSELLELKNMLLQYPAGSLERAAIEEEIKKLSQK